ncbi:MAG: ISKra4 family transposase, partial [bacterium]
ADGIRRTHVRGDTHRPVVTIFGEVEARREAYSQRGVPALHPVDADLNLPEDKYSHEVQRRVALDAAEISFEGTVQSLGRNTAARVGKFQIEQLARAAAGDFEAFYELRKFVEGTVEATGPMLILSVDQKGVVMRLEDLRDATRKLAEGKLRKLETRHCKGEPHGRKRMATVATVYTTQPHHRTATDVVNGLRNIRDLTPKAKPRPELKRVWASLADSPQDVIKDMFDEAMKRDPNQTKDWYVLLDGDDDLEAWVKKAAKECGVRVTIVLDFIHALQYLWKAGKAFHKEGTPELEQWVLERLHNVLLGKASDVAAGIRRSATLRGLTKDEREHVDKCARYFLKRTHLMRYDKLLKAGSPIATGVVEGTCKHLINDRLDVTGARWSLMGAEAVLRLRALIKSGDFDEYWGFHEAGLKRRNHASRYANGEVPEVEMPARAKPYLKVVK